MILNSISRHSKFTAYCFLLLFITDFAWAGRISVINRNTSGVNYVDNDRRYTGNLITGGDKPVQAHHSKVITAPATDKKPEFRFGIANNGVRKEFIGGPSQPEMAAFQSVNANNIVDLFSGDFSYNIALMDIGGYPIGLSYRGGISMDQEASWVGLGWNVNPGTITRNLRGLPDDFNGKVDSIKKVTTIKENKTIGVTAGGDVEIVGAPINVGASLGVFHNNYKGWGLENSVNASINSGTGAKGPLSGGLSITNNTQEGLTIAPSLSLKFGQYDAEEKGSYGTFTTSLPYNSRSGIKSLQMSVGVTQFKHDLENQKNSRSASNSFSSGISFASPTFTPSITMPFTSTQFSFTGKIGAEINAFHPDFFISGYVSKQGIKPQDTLLAVPSYGYLYYQEGAQNRSSLLDFNREKEIPYREKPAMPHIAVPMYTYDAFSITGEGTGGMFRAYRGDIGFVHDHFIRTKDNSNRISIDLGTGNLVHGGIDLNINRAFTQNGPWLGDNTLKNIIDFRSNKDSFEAVYFRNPGEKAINSKNFYNTVGGDDVVTIGLFQAGSSSSSIQATNYLLRYKNKRLVGQSLLTAQNTYKPQRDKRTQVITRLNAKEADAVGLSKYIENYTINQFTPDNCSINNFEDPEPTGTGLLAEYYKQPNFGGTPDLRPDGVVNFDWGKGAPYTGFPSDRFSIRRYGRLKAPVTGTYNIKTDSDDGIRVWLNDSLIINQWDDHPHMINTSVVNLVEGEFYTIRMEYYENKGKAVTRLLWSHPSQVTVVPIPQQYLFPPAQTEYTVSPNLVREKRTNSFRKETHISEFDVLNTDGKRYIYGIPVYNFRQKEATFAVQSTRGNSQTGLAGYNNGIDNTTNNKNGKDWYYNSEITPAYPHSFLLTGVLSEDYVDVTGNGISNDDLGDAVKFNYSKVSGPANPYRWRAPYVPDSVTYNESLRTDNRDDKGSYVYGEKELWYLHSIESKTMIATFVVENRLDLLAIDEAGHKYNDNGPKRLKEINLYSKADFIKKGTSARPVKSVHFEYSYELCPGVNRPVTDSGKLTLKRVWFSYNGNNKGKQNPYQFSYSSKNPSYNLKSGDRWGSYKEPLQNPGSISGNVITNAEYPYAIQDSTAAAINAGAWSLDSILLPSGGALKIVYEGDDYGYVQNRTAMQLFKLKGLASAPDAATYTNQLYTSGGDNLYAYIAVPQAVSSKADVYQKYLKGIQKLFFKLYVKMPSDQFGAGYEYVSCYADLDGGDGYGFLNANTIWVKVSGISLKGDEPGSYNPLAKAAIQFLRLNLPSKAYPGSETGDNVDLAEGVRMIFSLADNIKNAFSSFDRIARGNDKQWGSIIDTNRTFIRLNNPYYKKYGGGHRVKKVIIYDKWDKMTGQRAAMYGREYTYTTQKVINGVTQRISSGVASYEPGIGSEENPFRQPIEYVEKIAPLGPVTLGYSEEPLGESLFPSPSVGYSNVRVRTINYKNVKSANGFTESSFYTTYDFPVYTDRTMLDNDTKKRYKPALANFLRINAKHYVTLSQGFKVELNDMNGKQRYEASYSETDPNTPIKYSENVYRVADPRMEFKKLDNTVSVISPDGLIDTTAIVGKDVELMVDMREQVSITNGNNVNLNADMFSIPFLPPFLVIPSFLNLAQREENQFRSAATLKVIQRYGILDSVIQIDKGSKVSTKDLLYDSETGEVVLSRTQNEFNDPVYTFNYPSYWAFEGMGPAYKNIDIAFQHVQIRDGKIISGLPGPDSLFLSSGDEIMVSGKQAVGAQLPNCTVPFATFPLSTRAWAIDSSILKGGAKYFYIINRNGTPYTGYDVSIRIVRSGRRNLKNSAGVITTLVNPLLKNGTTQQYDVVFNTNSKVINANVAEFKQTWVTSNPICSTKLNTCPAGYTLNPNNPNYCIRDSIRPATILDTIDICLANYQDINYSACGSFIYNWTHTSCSPITNNNLWVNVQGFTEGACDPSSSCIFGGGGGGGQARMMAPQEIPSGIRKKKNLNAPIQLIPIASDSTARTMPLKSGPIRTLNPGLNTQLVIDQPQVQTEAFFFQPQVFPTGNDSLIGPLNRSGIWPCQPPGTQAYQPQGVYTGYTDTLFIPETKAYYFGMAADNRINVYIDGVLFKHLDEGGTLRNFERWHIYPDSLTAGIHTIRIEGYNEVSGSSFNPALFGVEVYNNTEQELRNARCYYGCANPLNMIFSTRDAVGKQFYEYGCPAGFTPNASNCIRRDSVLSTAGLGNITANNYVDGRLGSWREFKTYTYYTMRKETSPTLATNIRNDGTFNDYTSFWTFTGSKLRPQYDTTRWVWNSEMTLFNRKGSEIENKDPLGIYSAGIYGYDQSLPVATIRNSHINESAFDGFEDYDYQTFSCDTCSPLRHFDIGVNKNKIVSTQKHTGKYSLKIDGNTSVSLQYKLLADGIVPITSLTFNTTTNACYGGLAGLQSVTADTTSKLIGFLPYQGRKMVVSAWVKEEQDCSCVSYVNNTIAISFTGSGLTYGFKPTGNIVEGWQRYESVFDIPVAATQISISLQSNSASPAYFDDLRILPFNANMKSYVYNSADLRLMAELDENNYASLYEYNDDGTLIRVKKETQKGIKTITETRSAFVKQ